MTESRLTGLGVTLLGLFALFVLIPFGIVSPSNVDSLALAPEFWPIIIASVFTLMGVILATCPSKKETQEQSTSILPPARLARLAVILSVLFAVYFLVPLLGMIVSTALIIFGLSWMAGERRWKLLVILSLSVPMLLTIFFLFVANIPIPLGMFEFIYG